MKKSIILAIVLLVSFNSFSQTDTTKIEQYCEVIATPRMLSNKVTLEINYGEEKSYWRDTRLKTDDGRLKKFNTIVDALNYMGKQGWTFVNAYPVKIGDAQIYHFGFKKLFSKSEVDGN
ncbi:MAG TPA: hypothetical protein PLA68_09615 [Panacibacter sp.]|nr:hypothetical protein [Panacibacter sp.]